MDTSENAELGHEVPTLGNPDLPQEGEVNIADRPQSNTMGGPQNEVIESQFPNQMHAPATDISTQPFFWSSFNISRGACSEAGGRGSSRSRTSTSLTRSPG